MILIKKDSLVDGLLELSDSIDETLSNLDENSSVQQQQKSSIKDDIDKAIKDANDYNDKYKVVDVDEQQEQEERKQGVLDELSNLGEQAEKDAKSLDEAVGSENINELLEGNASEETKEESKDSLVEWLRDRVTGNESTSNTQKVVDKVGEDTINNALDGNLTEEDKQALLDVGKEEGLNAAQDLYNNKDGIVDGVKDKINEKKDSNDQEEKDKKTLTTDMENLTGSMTSLASMFSNTANGLSSDLRLVNSNYLEVLTLMANLLSGNYVEFNDISEKDTEKDYDGKVRNSINYGDISGDTNVGGISGEMALEFDYDMEGKYTSTLGDKELVSKTYETRCVARECINRGHVEGKKDNIGGITGNMEVGTIISCENYGPVSADKSTCIGGIVGMSSGTVKSCYAMCSFTGEMYIGGIAGKGYKIIDCYTLVEIRGAQSSYGTIAGYADMKLKANLTGIEDNTKLSDTGEEEEDPDCHIKGNFYVHDSVGAINGISYAGFAEPIEYSKLIEDENTPDDFRELKMTYVADGVTVGEVRFIYGEGLDTSLIPNVPFKEGYAGYWPEYDYSQLFFSDTLEAIYTARGVTLETEKHRVDSEMPVVLVEGSFDDASTISFEEYTAGDTPSGTVEAWQLKITGNHDKDNAFVLHYYEPETNLFTRIIIYVLDANGEWQKVAATQSGSYMMLNGTGDEMIFAAVKAPSPLFMILAGSAVLILFVALFIALKKKKNH
ncbi:MAG: hypothetical protein KBS79_05480 [Lachnospiraceae bacterium]|nr:hypothetical protein [Candidatus Minthocola equi]